MKTSYPKSLHFRRYEGWEHAYFPYLVEMYGMICDDEEFDVRDMANFFAFVFENSSGEISPYLPEPSRSDEEAYIDYLIKKTEGMLNERRRRN